MLIGINGQVEIRGPIKMDQIAKKVVISQSGV